MALCYDAFNALRKAQEELKGTYVLFITADGLESTKSMPGIPQTRPNTVSLPAYKVMGSVEPEFYRLYEFYRERSTPDRPAYREKDV